MYLIPIILPPDGSTRMIWIPSSAISLLHSCPTAGFWPQDYAFVYTPVWFTDLGTNVEVTASYAGSEFLVSGFWPDWTGSGAAGQPAIVHESSGESDVSVLGIDATFRGHPENAFRLLGNAIFSSQ